MLTEASALVASHHRPGVYWTLNDTRHDSLLFAVDQQGRSLGRFRVNGAANEDWEALQFGPGPDGKDALYVGDTGDNKGKRQQMAIYRVPEPEPADALGEIASTAAAEVFRFVYPGSPRNTEAMLVHPTTGEILLVTKEPSGQSVVFRMPTPLDSGTTVTLEQVGAITVSGGAGEQAKLVTDGTVAPDGQHVTIRTYTSALEFEIPVGAPLASIGGQPPRVIPLDDGKKGEGLTYRLDGNALISIGEGTRTQLFETPREC